VPEIIGGMCIAIVVLGTFYSSFGLQWPTLGKRVYWIVGLTLAYALIRTALHMN
jgi:hypothetical protein